MKNRCFECKKKVSKKNGKWLELPSKANVLICNDCYERIKAENAKAEEVKNESQ